MVPETTSPAHGTLNSTAGTSESVDDAADPVALGVALLASLEHEELSLAAVMDRIETVTTDPAVTR